MSAFYNAGRAIGRWFANRFRRRAQGVYWFTWRYAYPRAGVPMSYDQDGKAMPIVFTIAFGPSPDMAKPIAGYNFTIEMAREIVARGADTIDRYEAAVALT